MKGRRCGLHVYVLDMGHETSPLGKVASQFWWLKSFLGKEKGNTCVSPFLMENVGNAIRDNKGQLH